MRANPERILKLVLQINGWIMATAVFAVFLSHDQMATIHQWLGLGKFPDAKIVDYLARSLSGFYAILGVLYIALARDIHAYASIIALAAWVSICFGIGSIIINLQLNFPLWWTWGEGPFIILYGMVILWLQKRTNHWVAASDEVDREIKDEAQS